MQNISNNNNNKLSMAYNLSNMSKGQANNILDDEDIKRPMSPTPTSSNMRLRFNKFLSNIRG